MESSAPLRSAGRLCVLNGRPTSLIKSRLEEQTALRSRRWSDAIERTSPSIAMPSWDVPFFFLLHLHVRNAMRALPDVTPLTETRGNVPVQKGVQMPYRNAFSWILLLVGFAFSDAFLLLPQRAPFGSPHRFPHFPPSFINPHFPRHVSFGGPNSTSCRTPIAS